MDMMATPTEVDVADGDFAVGIGLTLFDNLVTFAVLRNLQGSVEGSRTSYALGTSLRKAIQRIMN